MADSNRHEDQSDDSLSGEVASETSIDSYVHCFPVDLQQVHLEDQSLDSTVRNEATGGSRNSSSVQSSCDPVDPTIDVVLGLTFHCDKMRGQDEWQKYRGDRRTVSMEEASQLKEEFLAYWTGKLMQVQYPLTRPPKMFRTVQFQSEFTFEWKHVTRTGEKTYFVVEAEAEHVQNDVQTKKHKKKSSSEQDRSNETNQNKRLRASDEEGDYASFNANIAQPSFESIATSSPATQKDNFGQNNEPQVDPLRHLQCNFSSLVNVSASSMGDPNFKQIMKQISECTVVDDFVLAYLDPLFEACLERITKAQYQYGEHHLRHAWAMDWAERMKQQDPFAKSLNADRKACLELLYALCNRWRPKDPAATPTVSEADIVNVFKGTRVKHILYCCLAMDRANALYNMVDSKTNLPGMHWYSHKDMETVYAWRVSYGEDRANEPTINKRLTWLFAIEGLGLHDEDLLKYLMEPCRTPLALACAAQKLAPRQEKENKESIQLHQQTEVLGDHRQAAEAYQKAAELGETWAIEKLAESYFEGSHDATKDLDKGLRLYQKAADQGDTYAIKQLAKIYLEGLYGVSTNHDRGLQIYQTAVDHGDTYAMKQLAQFYLRGLYGVTKDQDKGLQLYQKAVDLGDADAMNVLAKIYLGGFHGVTKDLDMGLLLYQEAADQGETWAMEKLAEIYCEGSYGVTKDLDKGLQLYHNAADHGDTDVMRKLAKFYLRGSYGVNKDPEKGLQLYQKAADQGDTDAMNLLANIYLGGLHGDTTDLDKGLRLYHKAADHGHTYAIQQLAKIYCEGSYGVNKDIEKGLQVYQTAVDQGQTWATEKLAEIYSEVLGDDRRAAGVYQRMRTMK